MRPSLAATFVAFLAAGCATTARTVTAVAPLGASGEVELYLSPLPREGERLAFKVESVSLLRADGTTTPLEVDAREVQGARDHDQRMLAHGRVPPGDYAGFQLKAAAAVLLRDGESSRLLVEPEPAVVDFHLHVPAGRPVVAWVGLKVLESLRGDYGFAPALSIQLAPLVPVQTALYCTNTDGADVTVIDRRARLVTGVMPVGASPRGIALDERSGRAWVSLHDEDQLEVLDLASSSPIGRIRLAPGDGPGDLGLAADGTLVVLNERSRSVAFVNPSTGAEVGRVKIGEAPTSLLVDRSGRRAYLVDRGGTVTALDLPNRAIFAKATTEAEPLQADLSRDGTRLYVVHRGSAYLAVYALPALVGLPRVYVGLGATAVKVDPRTDLVYVSRGDERRIQVLEPLGLQPLEQLSLPGAATRLAIDDAENTLLALQPERRTIAILDLTSRRLLGELPVGVAPDTCVFAGKR